MPRVSVVVATHRRPALLAEALASVAARTLRDVETLVAEDGGTGETARVVALEAEPSAGLVFGPVERFGDARGTCPRRVPATVDLARLLRGSCVPLSAVLARREALEEAGLFPEEPEATPDYELWLRVARTRPLLGHPEPLVRYRAHAGGMSRRKALEVEELSALYDRLEAEWDLPPRPLSPARRGLLRARARLAPTLPEALRFRALSLAPGTIRHA